MALLALLIALAAPPEGAVAPRLQVADGVDCPTRAQIQKALDEWIGAAPAGSDAPPLLEVLLDDLGQLNVRLLSPTAKPIAEKTLDARGGSCAEVAQTIALLAKSWLADLAASPEVSPAPPDPAPPLPAPPLVETRETPPPRADRPYRLSVRLAAGAAFGNSVTLGGSLGVDLSLPSRFGLGLQFSLPGALKATDSSGRTMTVDRQVLALFATFDLVASRTERSPALAVLLGPTLLRYTGQAHGYSQSVDATGLEPGLVFGLRGSLPIFKGFFAYGELDGNAIANALHFQLVEGSAAGTTLVTQPSFWGWLSLGVGAQFL